MSGRYKIPCGEMQGFAEAELRHVCSGPAAEPTKLRGPAESLFRFLLGKRNGGLCSVAGG